MKAPNSNRLRHAVNDIDRQLRELRPFAEKYLRLGEVRNQLAAIMDDPSIPYLEPTLERPTVNIGDATGPELAAALAPKRSTANPTSRQLPPGDEIEYVRQGPVTRAIIKYVHDHPGQSVRVIADKVNTSTPYAFDVIRNLVHNGAVSRDEGRVYPIGDVATMMSAKSAPRPKAKRAAAKKAQTGHKRQPRQKAAA